MPVDVCPSADEFRRLLSGQLSDAGVEAIARHLEGCTQCPQTLQGLGDDTLIRALRTGSGKLVAQPERIERLIASCLARKKSSGQLETNADPETLPPSEESACEGIDLSFLGRPQQPEEIGRLGGYRVLRLLRAGGIGIVLAA